MKLLTIIYRRVMQHYRIDILERKFWIVFEKFITSEYKVIFPFQKWKILSISIMSSTLKGGQNKFLIVAFIKMLWHITLLCLSKTETYIS